MNAIQFTNWESALAGSGFHEGKQRSFTITIRWYPGWLKQRREPATCENARRFEFHAQPLSGFKTRRPKVEDPAGGQ